MTTLAILPRSVRLKEWMDEHRITYRATGEQLGITEQSVRKFLLQDWMPVRHHEKCVALGFPVDLLPTPFDKPKGRIRSKPHFPGLAAPATEGIRA